VGSDKTHVGQW